jgi:sugar phosphate isomerase/epimerase
LVSVTFRKLRPAEIVRLAAEAKLEGIEWGGDTHVPHGDVARAKEAAHLTVDAGLKVASYGSYHYVAEDPLESFAEVVECAMALGAPMIRVWAGKRGSDHADVDYRRRVVEDSIRVADLAAAGGIGVAFEFHDGTLNDRPDSSRRLLEAIGRPDVSTYWQPPVDMSLDECLEGLRTVLARLSNVHVYHWQGMQRLPLEQGEDRWRRYLELVSRSGRSHWAMLEFIADDNPQDLLRDAATLRRLLGDL